MRSPSYFRIFVVKVLQQRSKKWERNVKKEQRISFKFVQFLSPLCLSLHRTNIEQNLSISSGDIELPIFSCKFGSKSTPLHSLLLNGQKTLLLDFCLLQGFNTLPSYYIMQKSDIGHDSESFSLPFTVLFFNCFNFLFVFWHIYFFKTTSVSLVWHEILFLVQYNFKN